MSAGTVRADQGRRRADLVVLRRRVAVAVALVAGLGMGCDDDPPKEAGGTASPPAARTADAMGALLALGTPQSLASSGYFSCVILDAGVVKCWGYNGDGELGAGDTTWRGNMPGQMGDALPIAPLGRPAVALATGSSHACALLDNGQVKCWGYNSAGQLGLGDTFSRGDEPQEMGVFLPAVDLGVGRTAKAITGGDYHTCALLDTNQIKCWGNNSNGQLGRGNIDTRGDNQGEMGDMLAVIPLGTGRTATRVAAGGYHTCALLDNNQIKCWGYNAQGQLGVGDGNGRGDEPGELGDVLPQVALGTGRSAKALAAGRYHTCAILDNNQVKCWGYNFEGELGIGDMNDRGTAAAQMGDALPQVLLGMGRTATSIGAGDYHTCAVLDNGTLKCWGANWYGQLGQDATDNRGDAGGELGNTLQPITLGAGRTVVALAPGIGHTCVVLDNRRTKCWGWGYYGQLGTGDANDRGDQPGETAALQPLFLGARAVRQIAMGRYHVCATLADNRLKCWGSNSAGQLGLEDTDDRGNAPGELGAALPTVNLGTGRTVSATASPAVAASDGATCAILDNGQVKCWGTNGSGQLGMGDTTSRGNTPGSMGDALGFVALGTGRTAVAISAASTHACVLLDNAQVKCWGGDARILGLGIADAMSNVGDQSNEMGNNLPVVNLGTGRTARAISSGYFQTCAILDTNQVKCWGGNQFGALGLGDTTLHGDAASEMGNGLPIVQLGTGRTAKVIHAGYYRTCAILDNDQLKCWGIYPGLGDTAARGDGANEMGDNLPAIQLGVGRTVLGVALGLTASCALLDTRQVKCWGSEAGVGQSLPYPYILGDEPNEMGDFLPTVSLGTDRTVLAVAGGKLYDICALLDTNQIKCWGANSFGELGIGDTIPRGYFPGVVDMGDLLPPVDLGPEP